MRREMKSYTWIAMTVMLLWSVALFATNAPKGNNQSDNRPFRYTLVQGKTAPTTMPFHSTSTYQSVVGESNSGRQSDSLLHTFPCTQRCR